MSASPAPRLRRNDPAQAGAPAAGFVPAVVDEEPGGRRLPDGPPVKILLVDDQPANLVALEAMIAEPGRILVKAGSGQEALRRLLREDFALVLLDVRMPGMDGLETAALIRGRDRSRHLPIIFLTAFDRDGAETTRGYELGAVDFLYKPIVPADLRAKVAVFVDLFRKTEQVRRQGEWLRQAEQREHERELAEARERLEEGRRQEERRVARRIQQRLFPEAPPEAPGFELAGASFPAEATGGDYFDYFPWPGGGVAVAVGDVTGHGAGPALLMAETRAYLRAFAQTGVGVGEALALLNRALAADLPEDHFVTLVLTRLDPAARTLTYASAGHTTGYVLDPDGGVKAELGSTGLPLGILPDADFSVPPAVTLAAGDTAVLLTDGVFEACAEEGAQFGMERALEVVRANRDRPAAEIVEALCAAARGHCGGTPGDDVTAVVLKAGPAP